MYYYFRDHGGWFKENYTEQGKVYWFTRTILSGLIAYQVCG